MGKSLRRVIFEFLNDILDDQQRANFIGLVAIIIQYVQIYAAQFAPFLFRGEIKDGIDSFFSCIVLFSSSTGTYCSKIYVIYIVYGILFLIIVCFFWAFTQQIKVKGVFKYIRTIIRVFPCLILLYPLIGHAGMKLHDVIYKYGNWYDYLMILFDLIFYNLLIILVYYLTPVIAGSPLCGNSHIPCRFLPDFGFTKFVQQDHFGFFILIASQNEIIRIIYCVYQIIISMRRIIILFECPFYSIIHTRIAISMSFTIIMIQTGCILTIFWPLISTLDIFIISLIFMTITYGFINLITNIYYYKLQLAIESGDMKYLKQIDSQKLF